MSRRYFLLPLRTRSFALSEFRLSCFYICTFFGRAAPDRAGARPGARPYHPKACVFGIQYFAKLKIILLLMMRVIATVVVSHVHAHHHPAHPHSLLLVPRHHLLHLLVHRLTLFDQSVQYGHDSVELLVGRCVIHFSDEFIDIGILILQVRHHLAFAHHTFHLLHVFHIRALLLLLIGRFSFT